MLYFIYIYIYIYIARGILELSPVATLRKYILTQQKQKKIPKNSQVVKIIKRGY